MATSPDPTRAEPNMTHEERAAMIVGASAGREKPDWGVVRGWIVGHLSEAVHEEKMRCADIAAHDAECLKDRQQLDCHYVAKSIESSILRGVRVAKGR